MHVARIRSGYTDKQGQRREYESRYLRRTYRDDGKVRHETLANLSGLPETMIDSIEAALKGAALVPAARAVTILRSLPHGHVAAVHAMAVKLGLPALLGLWGSRTGPLWLTWAFYAARSYSLRRPPSTGWRLTRTWERSATG